MDPRKEIIEHYIDSYNRQDLAGMKRDLHPAVVFENVSGGVLNLRLEGIESFQKQAEETLKYFRTRKQTVKSWDFHTDQVVIKIEFSAVPAIDTPNGWKAGKTIYLEGRSEFTFDGLTIVQIMDVS